jgi:hypothetical protein
MDNDRLLNFTSRFVIIVPLFVIIIALIFKPFQKEYKKELIILTPTTQNAKNTFNFKNIDLNKEYVCDFKTKEATQTAYIKNKKVFIESINKNEINYFLLSGDCLFNWDKDEFSGEKICGLSSYISTAEKLLNTGLIDINTLIKNLKESGNSFSSNNTSNFDLKDLSCKSSTVNKDISFEVPTNILFKIKN